MKYTKILYKLRLHWASLDWPCGPAQQSKFVNWQVDGEYRGSDFTAAVTLGNPDVLVGSGKRHIPGPTQGEG